MKKTLTTLALGAAMAASPAMADLVFPDLSYRTGPYAAGGIPFSDGYNDYFTLLNERDGGIGGVPVRVVECETGYNTEKGVECYESTKGEGALVYQDQLLLAQRGKQHIDRIHVIARACNHVAERSVEKHSQLNIL